MKRSSIVSLFCAAAMTFGSLTSFAAAPSSYDGKAYDSLGYTSDDADGQFNLAVIANSDVKIVGGAMYIQGSVYSNGNIYVGDGRGNKIDGLFISGTESSVDVDEENGLSHTCEGYIHVNDNGTRDGITYYSVKPEYKGAIKDTDTSFECAYEAFTIPQIANDLGDTEMTVYYNNVWKWSLKKGFYSEPGPNAPKTITEDTHIGKLKMNGTQYNWRNLDAAMIIDATNNDVNVVIDSLPDAVNPSIKVVGTHRVNLYISDVSILKNLALNYNTNKRNANWQPEPELNGSTENTYVYLTGNGNVELQGCWIGANTIYVNADSLAINGSSHIVSNIESGADKFEITGGKTEVYGTVCVPNADSRVVDSGTLYGQLHTNTLTNNGAGRILWKADAAVAAAEPTAKPTAEPTAKPTVEPTVEPTAKPTAEPTAKPTVEPTVEPTAKPTVEPTVEPTAKPTAEPTEEPAPPATGEVFKGSSQYAYIFGDEPDLTNLDENGSPKIHMQPDRYVSREEACAMVMRLVDQFVGVDDSMAGSVASIIVEYSDWAAKGLGFISSKGTYDDLTDSISGYNYPTRGEIAKIVAMGLDLELKKGARAFNDIAGTPYEYYINVMTSNGYMQGNGDGTFNPNQAMTRAEFCAMFNNVTGREDYDLIDPEGNEVVPETYYIVDLAGAAAWQERAMMLGTSAFNKDYTVDVDTRLANIRNILDNYDSQKQH